MGTEDLEIRFIESLVNLSPALRHIRCDHKLSAENKGVGLWTKRIKSYSWISPSVPCYLLHESPSLRKLGIRGDPAVPLTLPALQVLKWSVDTYTSLYRITAHTCIPSSFAMIRGLDTVQAVRSPSPPCASQYILGSITQKSYRCSSLRPLSISQSNTRHAFRDQQHYSSSSTVLLTCQPLNHYTWIAHLPMPH